MGEDDGAAPAVDDDRPPSEQFKRRQDDLVLERVEPDISTSDEAVHILVSQGADAWREWVAEQRAAGAE